MEHPVHRIRSLEITLVWPNGADFDPAILHDWPDHEAGMIALARRWTAGRDEKVG